MRTIPTLLLVATLLCGSLPAQNLVVNPSFEQLKPRAVVGPCQFMFHAVNFQDAAQTWASFPNMTPDLLQASESCVWLPAAHSGEFCLGIIQYLPSEDVGQQNGYNEVVQGQLSAPLKPGKKYRVSVWVREDSVIAIEHLQKVYSPKTPVVPVRAGNLGFTFSVASRHLRSNFQQLVQDGLLRPQVNFSEVIATYGAWKQLSATFVPDQPFQHFVVGNFFKHYSTPNDLPPERHKEIARKNDAMKVPLDRTKRAAYLCLDDIAVTLEIEPDAPILSLEKQLLQERKFTFSAGVLFDFDKAELRFGASVELDSLVFF